MGMSGSPTRSQKNIRPRDVLCAEYDRPGERFVLGRTHEQEMCARRELRLRHRHAPDEARVEPDFGTLRGADLFFDACLRVGVLR